jgi:DNA repair protein RAD50
MQESLDDLDQINESIRRAETKVDRAKQALQEIERESNVAELQKNLTALDRQASKCNDEMSVLALQGDTRARLKNKQSDRQRKTEAYNSALIQMKPDAESLLKKPFAPATLEQDLAHLVSSQEGLVKTAKEKLKSVNAGVAGIEARLSMVRQTINQKTVEYDAKLAQVNELCGGLDYNAAVAQAEREVEQNGENVANMKSASSMYGKFIAKFEQGRCCPLCTRSFENQTLENQFKAKLSTTLSKIPLAAKASEAELAKWNDKLKQLRNFQTAWSDCERISKEEIPDAKSKRDQLEREKAAQFHVVEEIETEISIIEAELGHSVQLKAQAVQAKQIHSEIQQLERDSNSISQDLGASGLNRSMEDIQKELEKVNSQM